MDVVIEFLIFAKNKIWNYFIDEIEHKSKIILCVFSIFSIGIFLIFHYTIPELHNRCTTISNSYPAQTPSQTFFWHEKIFFDIYDIISH